MSVLHDITAKRFGRLTAQWPTGRKRNITYWMCLCVCGRLKVVPLSSLGKNTNSCGCLRSENSTIINLRHGHNRFGCRSMEYASWRNMLNRCLNPNVPKYESYGARGIKVCKRWRGVDGFTNFISDMGRKPSCLYTLDRINNDGDYTPKNCRWATAREQALNRRPRRKPCAK